MAIIRTGNATSEKREGRIAGTLTASDPRFESLVAGLDIDGAALHELRRFAKQMDTDAGRFQIRRRSGIFGARNLSKTAAEHVWCTAFGNGGSA